MRSRSLLAAVLIGAAALLALPGCVTGAGAADPAASTPAASHFKADLATAYGTLTVIETTTKVALQAGYLNGVQVDGFIAQRASFKKSLDDLVAAGDSPSNRTALANAIVAINAAKAIIQASQPGAPKS